MYFIFGIISVILVILSVITAVRLAKTERETRVLSALHWFTIGIFAAVLAIFIPVCYTESSIVFGDPYHDLRPLLLAVHSTLRVFIVDVDFEHFAGTVRAAAEQPEAIYVLYTVFSTALFVLAPILTFTNVLSLFRNLHDEFLFAMMKRREFYIMSKLNRKSITLAKDIVRMKEKRKDKKPYVIVFADVFLQNEEADYDLFTEVRDLRALCLKRDISHIDILSKKGDVELFLISDDETDNISQALKITKNLDDAFESCRHKARKNNIRIFPFSTKDYDSCILESAPRPHLSGQPVKLRRINEIRQFVWKTVPEMGLYDAVQNGDSSAPLSVMIVGMGSYGMEFFKMILWYCQYEGRKLEFNIIDRREGSEGARSIFRRHFPDLQETSTAAPHDDAIYDISFYEGVDIQTDALQDRILFENRLQRTDVVIVSLGDDDANIEAALYLRSLFDRVHVGQGKRRMTAVDNCNAKEGAHFMEHTSKPEIYAIVYDELKSGVLHDEAGNSAGPAYLTDHKGISFDIHFIGGMQSMYRHDMIYDQDTEDKAFARHSSWSTISGNSSHFEDHEYNRLSSAAQALYHSQFRKLNCGSCGNTVCRNPSAVCEKQARNEHIRWNAYMRTLGYTFISLEHTCHRAKIHGDLCSWAALNKKKEKEVRKDSIPTDETGGNTNVQAQSDQDRSHPASR